MCPRKSGISRAGSQGANQDFFRVRHLGFTGDFTVALERLVAACFNS